MFGCPPLILRNCGREHLRLSCVAISSQSMAASSAMNRAFYRYRRLARMPASNARTAPATVAEPVRARSTICDSGRGGSPVRSPSRGKPPHRRNSDAGAGCGQQHRATSGTNSKTETTRFVRAAFEGMQELLGPLHEESYVLVHATDGDAYGYGGRTQNGRWAAAHPG